MTSRLFDYAAKKFTNIGIGYLTDMLTGKVTEEINGQYVFNFTYPVDGVLFDEIRLGRIVTALSPKISYFGHKEQPFRINRISKPLNGVVEVYCEHISYDLTNKVIPPHKTAVNRNFVDFANELYSRNALNDTDFKFFGQARANSALSFTNPKPQSMRAVIGGDENSLLKFIPAELMWDEFNVIANEERGKKTSYVIRYGIDLLDILIEEGIAEAVSHIIPYVAIDTSSINGYDAENSYSYGDMCIFGGRVYALAASESLGHKPSGTNGGNGYWAYIGEQDSETNITTVLIPTVAYEVPDSMVIEKKAAPVDMSEFLGSTLPTAENLLTITEDYVASHSLGKSSPSITVDFVPLWQTDDFKELPIDILELGDELRVYCPKLTDTLTARITAYEYDTLSEMYSTITLGEIQKTAADYIIGARKEIYIMAGTNQLSANRRSSVEFAEQIANVAKSYYRNRRGKDASGNDVFCFQYAQNENWLTEGFDGSTMKGIDCSSFIGLVLRGIPFEKSPYLLSRSLAARVNPTGSDIDPEDPSGDDSGSDGTGTGDYKGKEANKVDYAWAINPYDYTYPLDVIGENTVSVNNMTPVRRASQIGNWMHDSGWDIYWDRTFAQVEIGDIVFWAKHNSDGSWRRPNRFMRISHIAIVTSKSFVDDYDSTFTYTLGNYAFITNKQLDDAFGEDRDYKEGLYRCIVDSSTGSVENRIDNFEYIGLHRYRHGMTEATGSEGVPSNTILNRTLERTNPSEVCLICRPDLGQISPAENAGNISNQLTEYTIPGRTGVYKDVEHLYKDGFYYLTTAVNINLPSDLGNTGSLKDTGAGFALLVRNTYRGNGQIYSCTQTLIDTNNNHTNDIWVRTKYLYRELNGEVNMYLPDDVAWTPWQRFINNNYLHIMAQANGLTEPYKNGKDWVCSNGGAKNKISLPATSVPAGYLPASNGSGGIDWTAPEATSYFYGQVKIPAGSNLNDAQWWIPGSYYINTGTDAQNISNCPLPVGAIMLVVALGDRNAQWKRQIMIGRTADLNIQMRYFNGSTITHWFAFEPRDLGA